MQAQATRAALFAISVAALIIGFLICRTIVTSKFGKVLVAIRDAEARTRFLGYRVESYKLFVFTLSACMAGVAGALYVPQVGIINPSEFAPANSIEAVIWVAVGGRGTLIGAVLGAVVVNYAKTTFTSGLLAPYWLFLLGGLFVSSRCSCRAASSAPGATCGRSIASAGRRSPARMPPRMPQPRRSRRSSAMENRTTSALLYLDGVSVSFDGFRALNDLSLADRAGRDARHHRPERRRQDHHDGRHHRQDAARQGRRLFRRRRSTSPSSTRRRSPSSASAANSRSRPCSRCTRSRTICASR